MRQLPLRIETKRRPRRTHGGWRPGAGRPRGNRVVHERRPPLDWRHPVHVTWRVVAGVPSLRSRRAFRVIRAALTAAARRFGLSICEFSVQSNHVHLVVEARDRPALSRALQGLGIRLARGLNRTFQRRGRLLADRFHAHVLKKPREVVHAVRYVRTNHLHHARVQDARVRAVAASMFPEPHGDPLSTHSFAHGIPLRYPETWLLKRARNELASAGPGRPTQHAKPPIEER